MQPVKYKRNFWGFVTHAIFFAFASSFMDVDTVIPSMIIKAGGSEILLGFLTAIMVGVPRFFQLFFASFLSHKEQKKGYLLVGIYLRVFSLFAMSFLLFISPSLTGSLIIVLVFVLVSIFSLSGSFAGVPYVDIMGKSVKPESRKKFFSAKQIINGIGFLISAFIVKEILKNTVYPYNYSILFLVAASLLTFASIGFWRLQEKITEISPRKSFLKFIKGIPSEVRKNPNLKFYLLIVNILGLSFSLLPFYIAFAKTKFDLPYSMIGNFLIFKILGMLVTGTVVYFIQSWINYKFLLRICVAIGFMLPIVALFLSDYQELYKFLFIFSGMYFSLFKVSADGVLLEISNDQNRSQYVGISGVGNILTVIFPLIAGVLISWLSYVGVFIGVSVFVLLSLLFIRKLNCRKSL